MERIKLQMREEQLQSSSYLAHIKEEIERTSKEIQAVHTINNRLEVEQFKNIDTLNKNSDNYKTDETLGLKQIKIIKEDIQRIHLQMFDKQKAIDNF